MTGSGFGTARISIEWANPVGGESGSQDGRMTEAPMSDGVRRVSEKLAELGHPHDVVMLPVTGRTSADAPTST